MGVALHIGKIEWACHHVIVDHAAFHFGAGVGYPTRLAGIMH